MEEKSILVNQGSPWRLSRFFQWQFLIRSKQYETFYKKSSIDYLICEDERLLKKMEKLFSELEELQPQLANVDYMIANNFGEDEMEEDELERRIEAERFEIEERKKELEAEIDYLNNDRNKIHIRGRIIQKEAEEKFKLRTKHFRDLKPEKQSLPANTNFNGLKMPLFGLPPNELAKMNKKTNNFFEGCIHRITHVDELTEIVKFSTLKLNPDGKLRQIIFNIDTRYPHFFLVEVFSKKLKKIMKSRNTQDNSPEGQNARKTRNEWEQWYEALEVYDLCEYVKRTYKGRDYLLETAKLMGKKHPDNAYWQYHQNKDKQYSNTHLSDRVRKKCEVAKRLIHSAGEGKLIARID